MNTSFQRCPLWFLLLITVVLKSTSVSAQSKPLLRATYIRYTLIGSASIPKSSADSSTLLIQGAEALVLPLLQPKDTIYMEVFSSSTIIKLANVPERIFEYPNNKNYFITKAVNDNGTKPDTTYFNLKLPNWTLTHTVSVGKKATNTILGYKCIKGICNERRMVDKDLTTQKYEFFFNSTLKLPSHVLITGVLPGKLPNGLLQVEYTRMWLGKPVKVVTKVIQLERL
jgi:hypothetical protein